MEHLKGLKNLGMTIRLRFGDFCVGDFIEVRQILDIMDLGNVRSRRVLIQY